MVYKCYILPIGGLYATYHLLGEPERTTDCLPNLITPVKTPYIGDDHPNSGNPRILGPILGIVMDI